MSTDSEFMKDPARFMNGTQISVPGNVTGGLGKYKLSPQAANYCVLANNGGIDAFYHKALPNSDNQAMLPNDNPIMFTDHLSGCQFLAYGASRSQLIVEHNNYIGNPGNYATRLADIGGLAGTNYLLSVTATGADSYDAAGNVHTVTYDPMGTANVVGVKKEDGWYFYVRQQGMSDKGAVLGPL